jgi:hypothetical protein
VRKLEIGAIAESLAVFPLNLKQSSHQLSAFSHQHEKFEGLGFAESYPVFAHIWLIADG